jgi:hypothetical protein
LLVQTEAKRLYDGLLGEVESPSRFSREEVTILSGENVGVLSVLGKITKSLPTAGTADAGNTGNGTMTQVSGGDDTQIGTYTLTCTATAADGGTFAVAAPNGEALPDAEVGAAYVNPQINFTIGDGATDFAVGDIFTVEVSAGSGKCKAIDFDAVDGSQQACGIAAGDYDAGAADVKGVAFVRDASFIASALVWPAGATTDQKNKALAELKAMGIITADAA